MLDKIFKVMTEIGEYEFTLLAQRGLITKFNGEYYQQLRSQRIKDFKFEINYNTGTLQWNLEHVPMFLNFFRMDVLEATLTQIVGTELKRGCQYEREWIEGILFNKPTGEILVHSTNGNNYSADKIRVYSTETALTPLFNYAAMLLVTEVEDSGCKTCME